MLYIQNLAKSYGNRNLFENFSLSIEAGKSYAILGENGSGKSTFLRIIMGLEKPDQGKLFLENINITGKSVNKRAKMGITFASQFSSAIQGLTVKQNLSLIMDIHRQNIHIMLQQLNLVGLMEKRIHTLSGGEIKRLEILMALLTKPRCLLLDEPFSGIDLINRQTISQTLDGLKSSRTSVLIADHNIDILPQLTNEVILMTGSKVLHWSDWQSFKNDSLAAKGYFSNSDLTRR